MIFTETKLRGAYLIEPELFTDERGFFTCTWNQEDFARHGLKVRFVQANASFNKQRGTLRGMHFQVAPYQETKLVRCTVGAIYDVIIDLRESSPTFRQWTGVELTSSNRLELYVPEGFAHGFQTLMDNTEVAYQISEYYRPEAARGVRWDDPAFGIDWPLAISVMSERDRSHPFVAVATDSGWKFAGDGSS
jgi:dTDP-4-dehydrorhamnose 3,5-epimerase